MWTVQFSNSSVTFTGFNTEKEALDWANSMKVWGTFQIYPTEPEEV